MENINIEDAEQRLIELARRAEQGETIVIVRDGKPVADLVPHERAGGLDLARGLNLQAIERFKRQRGVEKLVTYLAPDFDEPLPEDVLIAPLSGAANGQ